MINEFPNKAWSIVSVSRIIRKITTDGTTECKPGSRVGKFLPVSGKKTFFSMVKTGLGKIVFAGKNFPCMLMSSQVLLNDVQ